MSREGFQLLAITSALICLGIIMTFSASAMYAYERFGSSTHFLRRELLFCFLGAIGLATCYRLDPAWLERHSRKIFLAAVFAMFLVYLPFMGHTAGGARRWIHLFGFSLQPVEFLKLAVCIYFSDYLARKTKLIQRGSLLVFLPPVLMLGAVSGVLILQPDLGSVIILFLVAALLFFLSGIRLRYIVILLAVILVFLGIAILIKPYRFRRVEAFLNPWQDPRGAGFQIIQSFIALGVGGIQGVGLGQSTQKLFYLPQSYTDFIFAILGEELGLIGALVAVLLFVALMMVGLKIAARETYVFRKLLVCSLIYLITAQAVINILVVTGMIPTKGLALPFISYGGSSLLANMMAIGLVLGVDRKQVG